MVQIRFSELFAADQLRRIFYTAIGHINGNNIDAMRDTIYSKADSTIFDIRSAVANAFPTKEHMDVLHDQPQWYQDCVGTFWEQKNIWAEASYRTGFISAYPAAFMDGLMLGIDSRDFIPPYTLANGRRRADDLIGRDKLNQRMNDCKVWFMERVYRPSISSFDELHIETEFKYLMRSELAWLGFKLGYSNAIGVAVFDAFELGRLFRDAVDQRGNSELVLSD